MNVKEQIYDARRAFVLANDKPPSVLFVSIGFHTLLWVHLVSGGYVDARRPSLSGYKFMGMTIHVVPTLSEGFYVA